ncbi:hypothetical protein EIJ81_00235 (plasmid) [Aliivibrio salmonicida]|uniref:hypothetical protein n=1 Tax=Aliivibrio salmonicida TaxID=40269 RepID=UPI000F6EE0DD|nr:hypothetical protein [Aliivibrio salmonicida]AZL83331.1 hypothetical protein EIJ81_00235 [Aliivibrio salmonicida]
MKVAKLISITQSAISLNLDPIRVVEKVQFVDVLAGTTLTINKNVQYVFLENAMCDPEVARLFIEKCKEIRAIKWVVIISIVDEMTSLPIYFDLSMRLEEQDNQVKLKIVNKSKMMYIDTRKLLAVLDILKSKNGIKAVVEWVNLIKLYLSVQIRFR